MKFFCIILTLVCSCHVISTQGDDQYSGLGFLKPYVEERVRNCGQIWLFGCGSTSTPSTQPKGECRCATNLALSSDAIELQNLSLTTGHLGGRLTMLCAFSGYPLATISWTGPQNSLPAGRHTKSNWDTTLIITNVTAADEGNYTCRGSNMFGQDERTMEILVVAAPEFKSARDVPNNATVNEGESVTFSCNPYSRPAAKVVWLQNGQPIDAGNPPQRFVFSNGNRNLTIRNVCRDCVDRESRTDEMVIQCNASNAHGFILAQGSLKVLIKTNVTIKGPENVSVDFLEKKQFVFQCFATSDPTTRSTVRWYKTKPFNVLVRNEPPYVRVTNEFLIITTYPNCSAECVKYLGEYRCVGDNGHSQHNQTITLNYVFRPPPDEQNTKADIEEEETWATWKTYLAIGAIAVGLLLVGIFIHWRSKRSSDGVRTKEGKLPNPPGIYEDIGYDAVGLEDLSENKDPRMTGVPNAYDTIGYDSIDQEPHSSDAHGDIGYDSIDAPSSESTGVDGPVQLDGKGYTVLKRDTTDGGAIHP